MSLSKTSMLDIIKKQYTFKLRAYMQVFMSMVFIQMLGILFSFNGVGMSGGGSNTLSVNVHYYSADIVVAFTIVWAIISAILITTQAYRNDDFVFITNRMSSNFSNILFLLTASIIGGITAIMSTYVMKVLMYVLGRTEYLSSPIAVPEMLIGFGATILYVFLGTAIGYFIGTLVQLNKVFVVLVPGVFIGMIVLGAGSMNGGFFQDMIKFIFMESSFALFFIKIIILVILLFSSSAMLSNRLEVR
ncbi:hypothetical protein V7124_19305 [Neobacillus niacini]|uniref:hypothetical protein n=1 Tax=Neobacillus niacini TaxID=86668 RepID=UPI002FFFB86E